MPSVSPERTIRTHANIVHLAGDRAYKRKKPVKYAFLDYSTLALRKHFVFEELRLNRRFAPDVYLGVVEILNESEPLQVSELLQQPRDNSAARDYAVVMQRIAEDAWLPAMARAGSLTPGHMQALMQRLVQTWRENPADETTRANGLPANLRHNTVANIAECERFVPLCLDRPAWQRLDALLRGWFEANQALFEARVRQDRIRDGHGDLKPGNIAFVNGRPIITDCIEFNPLFRRLDTLAEAAFLATGLQSLGRFDLAAQVLSAYQQAASDDYPQALRRYYQAHLACVMGKVTALQLDDPGIDDNQRQSATKAARGHFALAGFYAREPHVLMVGGIMGCGKSTLSAALSAATGWPAFNSDVLRKQLWGVAPNQRLPQQAYTDEAAIAVYQALAGKVAHAGGGVILDAQWPSVPLRAIATKAAHDAGGTATMVLCDAPDETVRQRMDERERNPQRVSDATSDLLAKARSRFVAPQAAEGLRVVAVDTTRAVPEAVGQVMAELVWAAD